MKQVLMVTAFSIGALFSQAQSKDCEISFGIKGGLNIANMDFQNSSMLNPRANFNVGGLAHYHLNRNFALQTETMFSGQGARQTIGHNSYEYNLNYVTMPLLVQYMFANGFRVESGPQPGVLVSAKEKIEGVETDFRSDFKDFDFAWVFGAGYLTPSGFGVDARFNLGLADIHNTGANSIMNRTFALGVFYQFKPIRLIKNK